MDLTGTLELGKLREDELQCLPDALVGILLDPVMRGLEIADGDGQEELATVGLLLQGFA